jgi:hypothetical protein
MLYIMFGMWIVALAVVFHMMINLNWKTGDWKGKHKGKLWPI